MIPLVIFKHDFLRVDKVHLADSLEVRVGEETALFLLVMGDRGNLLLTLHPLPVLLYPLGGAHFHLTVQQR
jgi:hypothetical protein